MVLNFFSLWNSNRTAVAVFVVNDGKHQADDGKEASE